MNTKPQIKIALTEEQRKQIQNATGKEVAAVRLALEPLEGRVALATLN